MGESRFHIKSFSSSSSSSFFQCGKDDDDDEIATSSKGKVVCVSTERPECQESGSGKILFFDYTRID